MSNILVGPNGYRMRVFRPYINMEETTENLNLWDPEGRMLAGLYSNNPRNTDFRTAFENYKCIAKNRNNVRPY